MTVSPFHAKIISLCIELSSRKKMFVPLIFIYFNPSLMASVQKKKKS